MKLADAKALKQNTPGEAAAEKAAEEQLQHEENKREAKRTADSVSKKKIMAKGALLTAAGVVLLMAILFAASALLSFEGSFTIKTRNPVMDRKAISLSETIGFANPVTRLSAIAISTWTIPTSSGPRPLRT